jgi:hypothetical protein
VPGKDISFRELLLSQKERNVDTPPMQNKPPSIYRIFPPLSLSSTKKKNKGAKKKLYISSIFIFFAFLAARYIYTSRDTAERIPGFPEAPNRSPHHRSPSSRRPLLPYRSIRRPRSPFFFVLLLEAGNNPFDTVINRPDRVPFSITSRILYHASLSLLHSSSSWTLEC